MSDRIEELYIKILSDGNWDYSDLDKLLELIREEGYVCGKLFMKQKAIKDFEAIIKNMPCVKQGFIELLNKE